MNLSTTKSERIKTYKKTNETEVQEYKISIAYPVLRGKTGAIQTYLKEQAKCQNFNPTV